MNVSRVTCQPLPLPTTLSRPSLITLKHHVSFAAMILILLSLGLSSHQLCRLRACSLWPPQYVCVISYYIFYHTSLNLMHQGFYTARPCSLGIPQINHCHALQTVKELLTCSAAERHWITFGTRTLFLSALIKSAIVFENVQLWWEELMVCTWCITPRIKFFIEKLKIPSSNHTHTKLLRTLCGLKLLPLSGLSEQPLWNWAQIYKSQA